MGTGKSAVGRCLAGRLGAAFVDLDEEIEKREVMGVTEIFERKGEKYFREAEHRLLLDICRRDRQIVALGGGAVCFERNRELLEEAGVVVVLTAAPQEIWRRIGSSPGRPLLAGQSGYGRMTALLRRRARDYGRYRMTVDTTGISPEEAAGRVDGLLGREEDPSGTVVAGGPEGTERT